MKFTPKKINAFLLLKLPMAYIAGVRVKRLDNTQAVVTVKHRWINQNPFKSMFWAVQGMASELATGILMMREIADSEKRISMLVTQVKGSFTKKATGRIQFICKENNLIKRTVKKAIETQTSQTVVLTSEGFNTDGILVSTFEYQWSLKLKKEFS